MGWDGDLVMDGLDGGMLLLLMCCQSFVLGFCDFGFFVLRAGDIHDESEAKCAYSVW